MAEYIVNTTISKRNAKEPRVLKMGTMDVNAKISKQVKSKQDGTLAEATTKVLQKQYKRDNK